MRYYCIGRSAEGRILTISYTERGGDLIRIISAREATRREEKAYESQDYLS
ncbi:MAG: BrnT family toxin [Blastocatellia bacterium]